MKKIILLVIMIVYLATLLSAPRGVVAKIENNAVQLTWFKEDIPEPNAVNLSHSTGSYSTALGMLGSAPVTWDFIPVNRFTQAQLNQMGVSGGQLTHISFYPNNTGNVQGRAVFALKVFSGGTANPFNPGTEIYSQIIPSSYIKWNEWNVFDLESVVTIPTEGELWIGYQARVSAGSVAGIDNAPVVNNQGNLYFWNAGLTPGWQTISTGNFMIRGRALPASATQTPVNLSNDTFNIYRSSLDNIDIPANWSQLSTNYSTLSYTDNNWVDISEDSYRYIVQSVDINGDISQPAFSNVLYRTPLNMNYIGDRAIDFTIEDRPVATKWETGVAQTIYLEEELYLSGQITGIMLSHWGTGSINPNITYNFWLATTTKDSFINNTDTVQFNEFTQVFSGTVPGFSQSGFNDVFIEFDQPFPYENGNLVFMGNKLHFQAFYPDNSFQHTPTFQNRTIGVNTLSDIVHPPFNPITIGGFTVHPSMANIAFVFESQGMATLTGIVETDSGSGGFVPLSDVLVELEDAGRFTTTNELGEFTINYITPGVYNIRASKVGFIDYEFEGLELPSDQIITHNIQLVPSSLVSVSGRIVSSVTNQPVTNARVELSGYANHPLVISDSEGLFTIENVFLGNTYTISVNALWHLPYIDNHLLINEIDQNVGDIMIFEMPYPPRNVIAELNDAENQVNISWEIPDIPDQLNPWFSHVNDNTVEAGLGGAGRPHTIEMAHRYTQTHLYIMGIAGKKLSTISFCLLNAIDSWYTILQSVNVNVYFTNDSESANNENLAYSQNVPINLIAFTNFSDEAIPAIWNDVELDADITIPMSGEMWITVQITASQGYPAAAGKQGVWTNGYGNLFAMDGTFDWETSVNTGFPRWQRDFMIKAKTDSVMPFVKNETQMPLYNVYRNDSTIPIITNINTTQFTDHTWQNAQFGNYRYLIEAVYNNNNLSDIAYSNYNVKTSTETIYLGDPNTPIDYYSSPFNYLFNTGLSQTIYLEDEIGVKGNIAHIGYEFNGDGRVPSTIPHKIWMATTDKNEFNSNSDWIPFSNFILVWEGTLPVTTLGYFTITIDLHEQFNYGAGNLVIMTQRMNIPPSFWTYNLWRHTETPNQNRTLYIHGSDEPHDPANLGEGEAPLDRFPNTYLSFSKITSINDNNDSIIVNNKLMQNYPNPFNPTTSIYFDLNKDNLVRIDIYNIRGQKVKTLINELLQKGRYNVIWNGDDENGNNVASGVYFYQMRTDEFVETRRMLLMK